MTKTEITNIYFLADMNGAIKIGRATSIKRRIQELQTASAEELKLLYQIKDVPVIMEKHIQDICQIFHIGGEWFESDCIAHLRSNPWFYDNMIPENDFISEYMNTMRPYYESKLKPFSI